MKLFKNKLMVMIVRSMMIMMIMIIEQEKNTQASFNTMRYKGRDSASGIDRKLSIIRPGATTIVAP